MRLVATGVRQSPAGSKASGNRPVVVLRAQSAAGRLGGSIKDMSSQLKDVRRTIEEESDPRVRAMMEG